MSDTVFADDVRGDLSLHQPAEGVLFRLIDLIVCVAVVLALAIGVVGVRRQAQEGSVIAECAARLQQIGQSLVLYQGLYDGQFPRTRYDPAAPLTAFTEPFAADPFAADGPKPNDTTAAMFLLARTMDLPAQTFVCPAAARHGLAEHDTFDRQSAKQRSNFRARVNNNYSLANMYPDAQATAAGYALDRFRDRLPTDFVIAGDTNPGSDDAKAATTQMSRMKMRMANSPNHQRDGQNVLFADGRVQFFNSPFVGANYDNVFVGRGESAQPAAATDTVLVPSWAEGPQVTPWSIRARRWVLVIAMIGTFAAIFWVVRHGMTKHPA